MCELGSWFTSWELGAVNWPCALDLHKSSFVKKEVLETNLGISIVFIFTKSKGVAKYQTIIYNKDIPTVLYTIFSADIKATFNVAQDMYIWQKLKS